MEAFHDGEEDVGFIELVGFGVTDGGDVLEVAVAGDVVDPGRHDHAVSTGEGFEELHVVDVFVLFASGDFFEFDFAETMRMCDGTHKTSPLFFGTSKLFKDQRVLERNGGKNARVLLKINKSDVSGAGEWILG